MSDNLADDIDPEEITARLCLECKGEGVQRWETERDRGHTNKEKQMSCAHCGDTTGVPGCCDAATIAALRAEVARKDAALRTLIERHATVVHAFPPKDSRRDAVRADCAEARAALAPAALAPDTKVK